MNFSVQSSMNKLLLFSVRHFHRRVSNAIAHLFGYFEYRVWLDDIRKTPADYNITVTSAQDAIAFLNTGRVTRISLDHDLGDLDKVGDGYQVAVWIERAAYFGQIPRAEVLIHTDNAARRPQMHMAIKNAKRYWDRYQI